MVCLLGYLDNVPMKLSKKFEPFDFPLEFDLLPEVRSLEQLNKEVSHSNTNPLLTIFIPLTV